MKTLKTIIIILLAIALDSNSFAQSSADSKSAVSRKETLKVSGNCGMCKTRIEKAAKLEGVSKADWDTESKILAVTYVPARTDLDKIGKKIAAAGHDNEKGKADDKAYNALPGCCKYDRKK